jgi:hypothetical protein
MVYAAFEAVLAMPEVQTVVVNKMVELGYTPKLSYWSDTLTLTETTPITRCLPCLAKRTDASLSDCIRLLLVT